MDPIRHTPYGRSGMIDTTVLIPLVAVLFVTIGLAVAFVNWKLGKRAAAAQQRWAHGAYSIWTGGEDSAAWHPEKAQGSLSAWYGATTSTAFWGVIRDLRSGTTGNPAWDRVRALDLLRIGRAADFIDDEQCANETARIGQELQQRYPGGWDQLAQGFEAGMHAWQQSRGIDDPEQLGRVQRNLPALRGQIWPAAPFHTKLSVEE